MGSSLIPQSSFLFNNELLPTLQSSPIFFAQLWHACVFNLWRQTPKFSVYECFLYLLGSVHRMTWGQNTLQRLIIKSYILRQLNKALCEYPIGVQKDGSLLWNVFGIFSEFCRPWLKWNLKRKYILHKSLYPLLPICSFFNFLLILCVYVYRHCIWTHVEVRRWLWRDRFCLSTM